MEDNKMYVKPQYKCGICGQTYDSVQERMNCEMMCIKKQQEEEAKAAEAKKKAEQEKRHAEVTAAIDNAFDLMQKYIKDYKRYDYDGKITDRDIFSTGKYMDFVPSKLLSYFLI